MSTEKWEYRVMTLLSDGFGVWTPNPRLAELADLKQRETYADQPSLNELGEAGWELAGIVPMHFDDENPPAPAGGFEPQRDQFLFYFKRRKAA